MLPREKPPSRCGCAIVSCLHPPTVQLVGRSEKEHYMPILRKVPTAQAAAWQPEREHIDADELLARVVGSDRVGLTRMEYPDNWGWMARVYGGGQTFVRFWADSAHGGPQQA